MPGPKHVPWPDKSGIDSGLTNHGLACAAHFDEDFHHRSGLGHAQINEMPQPSIGCRLDRNLDGNKIDLAKLLRLGWAGMWSAYQVDEGVTIAHVVCIGIHLQRVSNHD